jgi:hypothetical protein
MDGAGGAIFRPFSFGSRYLARPVQDQAPQGGRPCQSGSDPIESDQPFQLLVWPHFMSRQMMPSDWKML